MSEPPAPTPFDFNDHEAKAGELTNSGAQEADGRQPFEPHHDAVDRWFISEVGAEPSPQLKRQFKSRVERLVNRTPADDERQLGDLLLEGDDPEEDRIAALKVGVDISGDPVWRELKRLYDEARIRSSQRKPKVFDGEAFSAVMSRKNEKRLRKAEKSSELKTKSGSRKSRASLARSASRDASTIVDIQGFLDADIPVRITPKKAELVRPEFFSRADTKGISPRDPRDALVWLPHWEKATLDLRAMAMGIAAGANGARDFTLQLDDNVIEYAMGGGVAESSQSGCVAVLKTNSLRRARS